MDENLRAAGALHLCRRGLLWVAVIALLSTVRPEGEPWIGFAIVYAYAWLLVWGGFRLLKKAGAWPVSSSHRLVVGCFGEISNANLGSSEK